MGPTRAQPPNKQGARVVGGNEHWWRVTGSGVRLEAGRLVYEGTAYFFCTLECAAAFAGRPERFVRGT